jgi:DNA-binding response OmpR family regulator
MPVIMHVEDDRDLGLFIQEALRGKAEVIPAYTVREAKEYLKRRGYDLIILDIAMPDASGLELLEALPRLPAPPPVLILSASETASEVQKRVAAALVKSRVSEEKVIETILSLIHSAPKKPQPQTA